MKRILSLAVCSFVLLTGTVLITPIASACGLDCYASTITSQQATLAKNGNKTTGNFIGILGIKISQISKIAVQADWGKSEVITGKSEINSIFNILNSVRYSENVSLPVYSGYLYTMYFYKANNKIGYIVLGSYPIINGKRYNGSINIGKIEKIVGLYPPMPKQ